MSASTPGNGAASPTQIGPELQVQVTLQRFIVTRSEIQWRGIQRDAMVIFAFTLMGVIMGSIDKVGVWVLLTPFPLVYLAALWLQHDRRIGSLSQYLRSVIEPALKAYDGLEGLEEYLNANERARSYAQRHHFTAVMARLLFPSLQSLALAAGLGIFVHRGSFGLLQNTLMAVGALIILGSIALTFSKVKHVRIR
ncbi:MAG TPA: hypothetical protein VLA88_04300 [Candidatus Saccharimonadales bacterium]|nr:hypothetical protein [Candidatus Saccharimonadales bacterium]